MTTEQKQALQLLAADNIGAIVIAGRWIWPQDIRESQSVALQVIQHFQGALAVAC